MSSATSTAAAARSGWLFGAAPDLLLGCGLLYAVAFVLLCFFGSDVRSSLSPGMMPFIAVLIGAPHYGATILRVYERREDRRAYALFAVHATILLAALFVLATRWYFVGSLLLTVYLTWSPWHYTGQNYGLAVLFLRRRGVGLDAVTKRWLYAAFALSYLVVFVALHSHAPGAEYTPPLWASESYQMLSLDLPRVPADVAFHLALAGYAIATVVAAVRLLRRGSLRAAAPAFALVGTQALWFSIPVAMRRFGWLSGLEPFAPEYAGWYFFWAALGHSIQYLWVTSYFARNAPGFPGIPLYLGKALLAGTALWCVPGLLFSPDLLGRLPYDAGLSALVAAVVNLHHFVLDGAIWKLRDGRIARILVRSEPATAAPIAPAPRFAGGWLAVWAVGAASLLVFTASYFETEFGLRRAAQEADFPRMRTALERLDWMGRESAQNHLTVGRMFAGRGNEIAALHEIERSIELYPLPDAWITLGDLHERAGRNLEARDAIEHALELAPEVPGLLYRSASLANRTGDREVAVARLEKAVQLDPERKLYRVALDRLRERGDALPDAGDEGATVIE